MSKPLAEDLFALETNGITAYDAALREEVLVIAPVLCVLSDNPRHSEIMNHAGASANMYCRICWVCVHFPHCINAIVYKYICRQKKEI